MTSNGENGEAVLASFAKVGLGRVNFSVFGTTPEELAEVQDVRFRNPTRAARKVAVQLSARLRWLAACGTADGT